MLRHAADEQLHYQVLNTTRYNTAVSIFIALLTLLRPRECEQENGEFIWCCSRQQYEQLERPAVRVGPILRPSMPYGCLHCAELGHHSINSLHHPSITQ